MAMVIAAFGGLVAGLGLLGLGSPALLMQLVERPWRTRGGLIIAVIFRGIFGIVLLAGAGECRFPGMIRILGVFSLLSAALLPLLGYERIRRFIEWWLARPDGFIRAWALVAAVFGGFLIYAGVAPE